jgi:hypothetical protein
MLGQSIELALDVNFAILGSKVLQLFIDIDDT